MFIWIDNGKYFTAINKKLILFFFIRITRMSIDNENGMNTENDFEITTFCELSLIYLMIFWI